MGCAPASYVKPTFTPGMPGIYHRVEKGQTLWRISKTYDAKLDEIVKVNRISDATNIEVGQLVFIPYAQKKLPLNNKYSSDDFIWPIKGKIIATFGQNYNNIINKGINIHPYNNLDVVASRSGKVIFYADNFGYFGKTIIIDHNDGFSSIYAQNAEVFIKAGDNVQKGTLIAKVGRSLHFEIRKGHIAQNPYYYLPR